MVCVTLTATKITAAANGKRPGKADHNINIRPKLSLCVSLKGTWTNDGLDSDMKQFAFSKKHPCPLFFYFCTARLLA